MGGGGQRREKTGWKMKPESSPGVGRGWPEALGLVLGEPGLTAPGRAGSLKCESLDMLAWISSRTPPCGLGKGS